jgi:Secretion system C-terminal sorting domain
MNDTKEIFMRLTNIIKPHFRCLPALVRLCLVAFGLFCSYSFYAQGWQGWEHYHGGGGDDEANAVLELRDQGYIMVGNTRTTDANEKLNIYVIRTDVDGTVLWEKDLPLNGGDITEEFGNGIIKAHDGGFIIVGTTNGGGSFSGRDVLLMKIDSLGNKQWEKFYGDNEDNEGYSVEGTSDGGYVIVGTTFLQAQGNDDVYVVKVNIDGSIIEWENNYGSQQKDDVGRSIVQTPDGGFIIAGSTGELDERDVWIFKIGTNQIIQWDQTFGGSTADLAYSIIKTNDNNYVWAGRYSNAGNFYVSKIEDLGNSVDPLWVTEFGDEDDFEEARSVKQTRDGGYILTGTAEINLVDPQIALVKIDAQGDSLWTKLHGKSNALDFGISVKETVHGGFIVTGLTFQDFPNTFESDVVLLKTDSEGNAFTNRIRGNVFYDLENDCQYDGNEEGIRTWIVKAVGPETYYGTTDVDGNYDIPADTFQYDVSLVRPNDYWMPCVETYTVNFSQPYDTIVRNFPVAKETVCTDLEVDISTPFLEVCNTSTYRFTYCNHGTLNAEDVKLNLILDDELAYVDSEPGILTIDDSLYTFDIGNVAIGECRTGWIKVDVDCNAKLSQTHSIKASITPDDFCLTSPWEGSSIAVNGYCDGDSVRFEIKNVGTDAIPGNLNYIIVEDVIIGIQEQPIGPLQPDQSKLLAYPADGTTYRLVVPSPYQAEGHPGNSRPTIAVEGCVEGGGNDFTTGFYTQLPEDDKDHFRSVESQENLDIEATNPQLKRGYPKGYGDSLKIVTDTDLKYHIKFQNTGIDTAIRVVIRDTISPFLDPQTVRPGASSHDYEFEVYGDGILKFTFNNIGLADSSTNFAASNGFVKYRISQRLDNPIGTAIKNDAAIYFDYDAPPSTNEICHLVAGDLWTDFIIVNTNEVFLPGVNVNVYPNPFVDYVIFEVEGLQANQLYFNVFDLSGKLIRSEQFSSAKFQFYRKNMLAGMYVYKIEMKGQLVSTGKIIVK